MPSKIDRGAILRRFDNCLVATRGVDQVYNLAADMGGIGYITAFLASISCKDLKDRLEGGPVCQNSSHACQIQVSFFSRT